MAAPSGVIALWSGAIVDIPAGWILCDGAGGSPDMRDRFVVGAGGAYAVDATGGANTHVHTFTSNVHSHGIPAATNIQSGSGFVNGTTNDVVMGTVNAGDSRPPYYALAYIMKT